MLLNNFTPLVFSNLQTIAVNTNKIINITVKNNLIFSILKIIKAKIGKTIAANTAIIFTNTAALCFTTVVGFSHSILGNSRLIYRPATALNTAKITDIKIFSSK